MSKPCTWVRRLAAAALAAGTALVAAPSAQAAFVSTPESALDAIFSQSSFAGRTIDIRFNATVELHNTALLDVDVAADLDAVAQPFGVQAVAMFFVDSIEFCGNSINASFIGCAWNDANGLVVESVAAANASTGASLLGHELSHNLGLDHVSDPANLMFPTITGASLLTSTQVDTILNSSLVQVDGNGLRFIEITPYLVLPDVVSNVPEPASLLLATLGVGVVAWRCRRAARA